jgi:predicted ATPase/tRNA A-37 threonylcarbamoyl transferase component Bud32
MRVATTSMLKLDGYTIEKCLHQTSRSEVYAGVRQADDRRVVLKVYARDRIDAVERSRARREHEALARCAGLGVRGPLDLDLTGEKPVLVLDYIDAQQLDIHVAHAPASPEMFVDIAAALAAVLMRVHGAHYIHRDIKPSNVLVKRTPREVHLIDFGLAHPLGRVSPTGELRAATALLDDTLPYMAPEQSGRMARGIDHRSDLYSLGATLYFLLAQRPPFLMTDPLELIHAHIARVPDAPIDVVPGLPPVLSDIVMKLLRKEPEERYQSAQALHTDLLRCREPLAGHGTFSLRVVDGAPERPLFAGKLFGRDAEVAVLRDAYERVASGATELVLLAGRPGMGKSTLPSVLREALLATHGHLASGRFDSQTRDRAYSGFVAAFQSLIDQWMTESEERVAEWTARLHASLGAIAGVLVDLAPDLRLVLGNVPAPPRLGPNETHARLHTAVERFIAACATTAHPLVLCLDDVHLADAASLELLEALLRDAHPQALLVLALYCDDHAQAERLDALAERAKARYVSVRKLSLGPLSRPGAAALLAAVLGRTPADTAWLAECAERKTGNVPLLLQSFIELMTDRGALRHEAGTGWVWDEEAVVAADVQDSAVDLIADRIDGIDADARAVLAFASCIGDTFDLEHLAKLWSRDRATLDRCVYALCDAGLIVPCRGGLRFVHEQLRDAAEALLSQEELTRIHCEIGRRCMEQTPPDAVDERLFEIADHMNRAASLLTEAERTRVIDLDVRAGRRALASGAPSAAAAYFRAGLALSRGSDWVERPAQSFELYALCADSAIQGNDFDGAASLLDELETHVASTDKWSEVAVRRVVAYAMFRHPLQAGELALASLARLGLRWSLRPRAVRVFWDILRTDLALQRVRSARDLRPARAATDRTKAALALLSVGAGSFDAMSRHLALVSMAWRVRLLVTSGYVRAPGVQLVAYSAYRFYFMRNAAHLRRYADIGMEVSRTLDDPTAHLRARYVMCAMVNPWLMSRRAAVAPLRTLAETASELGERQYHGYCVLVWSQIRALSGVPLAQAERELVAIPAPGGELLARMFGLLREGGDDPARTASAIEALAAAPPVASTPIWIPAMFVLYVLGRADAAQQLFDRTQAHVVNQILGTALAADLWLLRGLIAGALARGAPARERRARLRILRQCVRHMRQFAKEGPDFAHMAALLAAERAALRGREAEAVALYRAAARGAERQRYIPHVALAHERRADLLRGARRYTQSAEATREAMHRYRVWGAEAKVAELARRHGVSLES